MCEIFSYQIKIIINSSFNINHKGNGFEHYIEENHIIILCCFYEGSSSQLDNISFCILKPLTQIKYGCQTYTSRKSEILYFLPINCYTCIKI
jgi:hypothetical protein